MENITQCSIYLRPTPECRAALKHIIMVLKHAAEDPENNAEDMWTAVDIMRDLRDQITLASK
jgi:hypothetical protein